MKANTSSVQWWMWAGALAICLAWPMSSFAVTTITFTATGTTLTPGVLGNGSTINTIKIYAYDSVAETYTGLNLQIQIADGGVNGNASGTGTQTGPMISAMTAGGMLTGTTGGTHTFAQGTSTAAYFDASGNPNLSESQIWTYTGATDKPTDTRTMPTTTVQGASTLLLTVTIDTRGNFSNGPWSLTIQNTKTGSPTQFLNVSVQDGTNATTDFIPAVNLQSIPEPASLGFLGILIPGMLLRRRRRACPA